MGIYKKLFSYAPERKGMAYVSIFFSLVSVVLLIMPFWYLWIFLRRLLVEQDTGGAPVRGKGAVGGGGFPGDD